MKYSKVMPIKAQHFKLKNISILSTVLLYVKLIIQSNFKKSL